jgi:hypothetical protein
MTTAELLDQRAAILGPKLWDSPAGLSVSEIVLRTEVRWHFASRADHAAALRELHGGVDMGGTG